MTWKFHVAAVAIGLATMAAIAGLLWLLDHSPSWLLTYGAYVGTAAILGFFAWAFGAYQLCLFPARWMVKETEPKQGMEHAP